ncbi:MAG: hypothetical protein LJU34_09870 [Oscillospiraceae bacterium]|nr:hypothetical protein [Oscillospiraceae bacterium]
MSESVVEASPEPTPTSSVENDSDSSDDSAEDISIQNGTTYEEMEYLHYDPEDFYDTLEQMTALAETGDSDSVLALYNSAYTAYLTADAMGTLSYIQYCADVTDEYWSEESVYCDTLLAEMGDALCIAGQQVLESSCGETFAAHIGESAADMFASYEAMTDREAELYARESELINQYYELMNQEADITYSYLGETWTWDKLDSYRGESLYYNDYEGYVEVYYGLMAAMNDLVGPVYVELMQLRAAQATLAGYDSYTDFVYELGYGRDYSAEDAQSLCDAVKPLAREFYDIYHGLYYSDLWYEYDSVTPVMDAEELLAVMEKYMGEIDDSLSEALNYMTTYGLYDIGTGANRISGAYTTTITLYNSPFVFATLAGDCYDLGTMTHEFGHFADAYLNQDFNYLSDIGSYDLFEIHSNGLEVLFTEFYDEIFTSGADVAEFIELGNQLLCVIEGCIYDEFQREVYANPDMTLDEINRLFCSICEEYGQYEPQNVDYYWMYVSHNFESPLYYISYAASSLAALQIWQLAQEDFQSGVDTYLSVISRGAYGDGYLTVLQNCGLTSFTQEGAASDILEPVLAYMEQLERSS